MFFFSIFCVLWHTYIVDNIPALCELDDPRRWEIRKCCNCIATDWLLPPLSDSKTRWNLWPQLYCHVMWATVKANLMLAMMIKQLFAILISHLNLEGEDMFLTGICSLCYAEKVMSGLHLPIWAATTVRSKKQNSVVVYHQELVLASRRAPAFLGMSIAGA